jgi:hypothetical protein
MRMGGFGPHFSPGFGGRSAFFHGGRHPAFFHGHRFFRHGRFFGAPFYGVGIYGGGGCYWNCRAAGFGPGYCSAYAWNFCYYTRTAQGQRLDGSKPLARRASDGAFACERLAAVSAIRR